MTTKQDKCKICGSNLVLPSGPINAEIGLIGEFPGVEEKRQFKPFVGVSGGILRAELGRIGISLWGCRATNLWMHDPSEADGELSWHTAQAIRAVKGCRFVLLMGSDVTGVFLEEKVMDIAGLRVETEFLPGAEVVVAAPNPAVLLHQGQGELRLALTKFKAAIEELKQNGKSKRREKIGSGPHLNRDRA